MDLIFRYPEGIAILLGIVLAISANYVLPAMGYSGEINLNWLQITGVGILFIGIALLVWKDS